MALELPLVEGGFSKHPVRIETLPGDPIHDFPSFVGTEGPHALVEDVDVVPSTAREYKLHRLLIETEVRLQKVVVEMQDLQPNRLEHFRIGHLGRVRKVVRVKIEDQVCPEPAFFLQRRGVRTLVIGARVVGVGRCTARQEVLQLFLPGEAKVSLHDSRGPEHEAELAPSEPIGQSRF